MVCFYIAVNTESGACTAPPERRGVLQAASLVVQVNIEGCLRPVLCLLSQVVIWVTAVVGLVLVGDSGFVELRLILNGLTGENCKLCSFCPFKGTEAHLVALLIQASVKAPLILGISCFRFCFFFEIQQVIFRAVASVIFFVGNISYLVASLILAALTLHAKLSGRTEATKRRPKVETCCSICSPYNGLTILHHLEHRFPVTHAQECHFPMYHAHGCHFPMYLGAE